MRMLDRLRAGGAQRAGYWEGMASGAAVLTSTYGSPDRESIMPTFQGYAEQAYGGNAVVFGAVAARLMLLSEATFKWQRLADKSMFGNTDLEKLELPWPNATTGELIARMEVDVSLAGNAYIWDAGEQLVRLRPDWVTIISQQQVDPSGRRYRKIIGYSYEPPKTSPDYGPAQLYDVEEIAHWSPIPDPCANFRGMSWLTPVVREVQADQQMTGYKTKYLQNAATPNMVIKYDQKLRPDTIDGIRERVQARYGGADNAFKTLVLDQGADYSVVGHSFEQMNFATVQAAGENRILIASRVPGIVVGSKEGLMAATYSNYAQAMRSFADLWARPSWRSLCATLAKLVVPRPAGCRLWFDTSDVAALRQGEKERADTLLVKATAAAELARYGWDPASIVSALEAGDLTLLKHPGPVVDTTTEVPKEAPLPIKLPDPPGSPASVSARPAALPAARPASNGRVPAAAGRA